MFIRLYLFFGLRLLPVGCTWSILLDLEDGSCSKYSGLRKFKVHLRQHILWKAWQKMVLMNKYTQKFYFLSIFYNEWPFFTVHGVLSFIVLKYVKIYINIIYFFCSLFVIAWIWTYWGTLILAHLEFLTTF